MVAKHQIKYLAEIAADKTGVVGLIQVLIVFIK